MKEAGLGMLVPHTVDMVAVRREFSTIADLEALQKEIQPP